MLSEESINNLIYKVNSKKWYDSRSYGQNQYFYTNAFWENGIILNMIDSVDSVYLDSYTELLFSEPVKRYMGVAENNSYVLEDVIKIAINDLYRTCKAARDFEKEDSIYLFQNYRIENVLVKLLPFGYKEVEITGDLVYLLGEKTPFFSGSYSVILNKDNRVVWPIDNFYLDESRSILSSERHYWFSFSNIPESVFTIMPVCDAFCLRDKGAVWGNQLLRLSPDGLEVIGGQYDGS